jgi:hypothetical protein
MTSFRDVQMERLAASSWVTCLSVASAVAASGLPAPTTQYLDSAFTKAEWRAAERAAAALQEHFCAARFAREVSHGIQLVPGSRAPLPSPARC